jgi:hypothetical protein
MFGVALPIVTRHVNLGELGRGEESVLDVACSQTAGLRRKQMRPRSVHALQTQARNSG